MRTVGIAFVVFLPMAALGTQVHEGGHFIAGWLLGWEPQLHYGWVTYHASESTHPGALQPWVKAWFGLAPDGARHGWEHGFATALGPLTNMAVGTAGMAWLRRRRPQRSADPLRAGDWAAVLTALFWSRQPFNLATGMLLGGRSHRDDESRLSLALGVPSWSVGLVLGALGLAACLWVVARVPRPFAFAVGGLAGSLAGFAGWYGWLGPLLLP